MIVVLVKIQSTSADINAVKSAVQAMEAASREEDGCIDYTFSVELNDPDVLRVTERWESMEALAAHFQSPHMAEFQTTMGAHPPRDMQVSFFNAEEFSPPGM